IYPLEDLIYNNKNQGKLIRDFILNKEVSLAILEEFHLYTRTKGFISSGGYDFAKEILYKSIGQEAADEVLEKLSRMK
ncbi:hypothetical protein ACP0F0_28020, partial [Escherichia coli]|uniref:magnesium and cobalt transport protein CorA n=1 Tax=Escherichia coli TaxID=562 RepID=UPI003CEB3A1C